MVLHTRYNLTNTSLALYYLLLVKQSEGTLNKTVNALLTLLRKDRDVYFPPEIFDDMMTIVEDEVTKGGATFETSARFSGYLRRQATVRVLPRTRTSHGQGASKSSDEQRSSRASWDLTVKSLDDDE